MDLSITNLVFIYLSPILYSLIWFFILRFGLLRHKVFFWIFSMIILFVIGFLSYEVKHYNEISRLGNGFLYLSPILFLGIVLLGLKQKTIRNLLLISIPAVLVLPILGILFMTFFLLLTGQITGV